MAKQSTLDWDLSKSESANAKATLPRLCSQYFAAGRKRLASNENSPGELHKFRLKTKRFRYSVELFRGCYGPGFDERLKRLHEIQDLLGKINDCAATIDILGRGHGKIAKPLEKRMKKKTEELRGYWRTTFDAKGQERWWAQYLARALSPARPSPAARRAAAAGIAPAESSKTVA